VGLDDLRGFFQTIRFRHSVHRAPEGLSRARRHFVRRAVPVGGAVGRCGRGAGGPSLPPRFISLCASSSFYSFLSLSHSLSGSLPASLCFCYASLRSLPLPAPAWHCGAGDVTRADSLPRSSSLSPQSRMSSIQNLQSFDPFADATKGDDLLPAGTEDYIHIRIQQRNGRKTLTTVQGIADDYDKKKLVKAFKKKFACNGTVIEHPEYGEVIQLQGDQRKNICQFLLEIGIVKEEQLKVHGF
uniref:Eukaryotic translation initiation factor 1B n=1 Tax=Corvus moneduloides TaxID=1196302 RepID=A0A8U7MAV1_CORMO